MANGILGGFFGKKENTDELKNASRVQDYLNRFKQYSREISNIGNKQIVNGQYDNSFLSSMMDISDERGIRYSEYREMCKVPELNQGLNIYCLHPSTIISTLKGDYTIKELSDGILGNEFEVWSYNIKENKVDIGKAKNPHITLKNTNVYKITFNNGESIIATSNHPFLLKTGEYKELNKLIPGDRVIPFYSRIKQGRPILSTMKYSSMGYHQYVYFLKTGKLIKRPYVIHHKDGNKFNNSLDNLVVMTNEEHSKIHSNEDKRIKKLIEITQNKKRNKKISKSWTQKRKKNFSNYLKELYKSSPNYKTRVARPNNLNGRWIDLDFDIYEESKKYTTLNEMSKFLNINRPVIMKRLQLLGFDSWEQLREHHCLNLMSENLDKKLSLLVKKSPYSRAYFYTIMEKIGHSSWANMQQNYNNHKVESIEYYGKSDVYDMEVEEFHNFNANGVFVHNSDNATQYNIENNVIEIQSENNKVIEILHDLFFERLDVNSNLWNWARNMCKLGDEFLEVTVDNITNPKRITSVERFKKPERVKRYEKKGVLQKFTYTKEDNDGTKTEKVFHAWRVVHFKIEEETFDPYGKSILEAGRKLWKRLALMEDAMLVYRISRAPERRVFYIDVGTLPTREANLFIEQTKRKFRKKPFINPNTGQIDEKANPLCITFDTKIPLLDGRILTLNELIKEHNNGKENWVYSIDRENNNQIVPGKIIWAGETRKNAQLIKVTLDNGKELRTTPDHKFMLRDGLYKEAQYLEKDDSLMPLYKKENQIYEQVYNPRTNRYKYTHHLVAEKEIKIPERKKECIHHCDYNPRNNDPKNLKVISVKEHHKIHNYAVIKSVEKRKWLWKNNENWANKTRQSISKASKKSWQRSNNKRRQNATNKIIRYNKSLKKRKITSELNKLYNTGENMGQIYNNSELHKQHNKIRSANMKKQFSDSILRKKYIDGMTTCSKFTKEFWNQLDNIAKNTELNIQGYISILNVINNAINNKELMKEWNSFCQQRQQNKLNKKIIERALKYRNYDSLQEWVTDLNLPTKDNRSIYQNHKVLKTEWLDYVEDTGCITIDKYHNFATDSGVIIKNSLDEDFFIPVRQNSNGTRIETLPPGQNLGEIDDVKYFRDGILKTLGIPPAYLGGGEQAGSYDPKSFLSQQDIQFARTIERIQKFVVKGLEKIAILELIFNKVETEQLNNFKIVLTPPSNVDQLMEINIRNEQFALINNIKSLGGTEGLPFLPDEWVYKNVLGFSDQEINKIKLQIQMQLQMNAQIQSMYGTGGGMEGGEGATGGSMAGLGGNVAGGEVVPGEAGGPEEGEAPENNAPELEIASNVVEFDGGKWLVENQKDVEKLIKYIHLYEKIHKDNSKKTVKEHKNGITRMTIKGEFRGLLKAENKSSNGCNNTLVESLLKNKDNTSTKKISKK